MKKLLFFVLMMSSITIFSQVILPLEQKKTITEEELKARGFKMANYPGGIDAFRKNFSQTFNTSKITAKGLIKSEAQFVISEEGKVTDIVIVGDDKPMNKEMERTIKAMSKTLWKPAELDGRPVKFRFRLPITMHFD